MKLAAHFVRYMANPDPSHLILGQMERDFNLVRDDILRALVLMRTFAAIDAFTLDKDDLKVALNLSLMQRLRVLESRKRSAELTQAATGVSKPAPLPVKEPRWAPEPRLVIGESEDSSVSPLVALISEHIRQAAQKLDDERAA